MDLPMQVEPTLLPGEPQAAVEALRDALAGSGADHADRGERLRAIVADHPEFLDGWAHLARWALEARDPVAAYAFARTGYHRGLDRLRRNGWRGRGPVPGHHEGNHGFLRSVHALGEAAARIGETAEVERCREFLAELDPGDALDLRSS